MTFRREHADISMPDERPCKGRCGKGTGGFTAEGMGPRTLEANAALIEDNQVWLCPDCIDKLE